MTGFNIQRIQSWQKQLNQSISLTIYVRQQNDSDIFYAFGQSIEKFCDHISVKFQNLDNDIPKIAITDNIHFHAVPDGTEIAPFIRALSYIQQPPKKTPDFNGIETLNETSLILFASPHCPHCPSMMQKILPMAWLNPKIQLSVIDVNLFPEYAEKYGIQSVPSLLYNDFQWTGMASIPEILDVIKNSPDKWHLTNLQRMISEGKATQLALAMLKNGRFFDDFDQLIAHELLSVRLGAMVCVEYIADEDIALAQTLCDKIWKWIPTVNTQVQGDLFYLLGICGEDKEIKRLQDFADAGVNKDLHEAIIEAIENIQGRS